MFEKCIAIFHCNQIYQSVKTEMANACVSPIEAVNMQQSIFPMRGEISIEQKN